MKMIEKEVILEELKKIISVYIADKSLLENITESTLLSGDLKVNSGHIVDIVLDAEAQFDIEFDDASFDKIATIGGCIEVIQEKLRSNANR
jgi:acyl carrier protein